MKAVLLYQSPRARTYVDAAASILMEFPNVTQFEILFASELDLEASERIELQAKIWAAARNLGSTEPIYDRVAKTDASQGVVESPLPDAMLAEGTVVDVSGAGKELATQTVAAAIQKGGARVGIHVWEEPISPGTSKIVGSDPHTYVVLTDLPSTRRLRRAFSRRTKLLYFLALFLTLVSGLGIGAIWIEELEVVNSVLVSVSVVVSFAALAFAAMEDNR